MRVLVDDQHRLQTVTRPHDLNYGRDLPVNDVIHVVDMEGVQDRLVFLAVLLFGRIETDVPLEAIEVSCLTVILEHDGKWREGRRTDEGHWRADTDRLFEIDCRGHVSFRSPFILAERADGSRMPAGDPSGPVRESLW